MPFGLLRANKGGSVRLSAANVLSDGQINLSADTVSIEAGRATHDDESERYTKKSFFGSKVSHSSKTKKSSFGGVLIGTEFL